MEVHNDKTNMQCFKFPCKKVGSSKTSCNMKNSTIALWSKYLLLVYKNLNIKTYSKKIEPLFAIEDVIVLNDILVCLDCQGNVHVNKDASEQFLMCQQNIKCICSSEIMNTRYAISLQYKHNQATLLVKNFNNHDTPNERDGWQFKMPNLDWMIPGDLNIMVCDYIQLEYLQRVQDFFQSRLTDSGYLLLIISFDKRNVYGGLFPIENMHNVQEMNSPNCWVKLYKSHTDIIDIKITMMKDIFILIGLAGGNIIKLPLSKDKKPEVHHLNTSIYKFVMKEDTVIYTDTLTMWKNENIFSKSDSIFEKFAVRNVRDFCLIGNQIICITFSNLIYSFNINHRSYTDIDYSCAVPLVSNSDYLQEIMAVVRKNEELHKKINKESEYLMALSLSNRLDIMDELIQVTANIFDDYQDVRSQNTDLTLTDDIGAYKDSDSYYFLINITVTKVQHKLNRLLSNVLGDIKIHITLFAQGVLKTTSIQIKEQLTTKNFVISLKRANQNIIRTQVQVKIITSIPGTHDENQRLWTVLYQKCIHLNAENYITMKTDTNTTFLKEETSLEKLILRRAVHLHGTEYKFQISDIPRYNWTFYVKIPNNYNLQDIFRLINPLNAQRAYFIHLMTVSNDKNSVQFQIGKELVRLNKEGGNLKVACSDIVIALDIRNFLANIIFDSVKDNMNQQLIDHKYYTAIENLKRNIISCNSKRLSKEEFAILLTRFFRNIHCVIPF